jgi:xanthine dehydrogenase accessory factor
MRRAGRVLVRGGGELASAAARLLFLSGFEVAVLEREAPLAVRRLVCFAEAVFSRAVEVEGVLSRLVPASSITGPWEAGFVPVVVDPEASCLSRVGADVLVDGRMSKQPGDTRIDQAPFVVGLGPGFFAGRDVHAVVETQRGADLGRVIWDGAAVADTSVPGLVAGHAETRVLRASRAGTFRGRCRIGDVVRVGAPVGDVDGTPVNASIGGLLRGLLGDGVPVRAGTKIGDIDPRGRGVDPARLSDKGRAVAAGVLEAILVGQNDAAASLLP